MIQPSRVGVSINDTASHLDEFDNSIVMSHETAIIMPPMQSIRLIDAPLASFAHDRFADAPLTECSITPRGQRDFSDD
jgi:hypothetical protein